MTNATFAIINAPKSYKLIYGQVCDNFMESKSEGLTVQSLDFQFFTEQPILSVFAVLAFIFFS